MENPGLEELQAFAPQWVLYWGGKLGPAQLKIWEPYLRRSGYRYLVLVDGEGAIPPEVLDRGAELPNVAYAHSGWPAERLEQVRSLQGVLYVGHRPHNRAAIAALPGKAHVFIGHGNSGKRSSGSRAALRFTAVLVASYSDLDRYPRPVRERLRTRVCAVGAPIVEGLSAPRATGAVPERPKVLYLSTWEGHSAQADYCSLSVVLASLQAAPPVRCEELVLRPHPGTGKVRSEVRSVRDAVAAYGARAPELDKAAAMQRADVAVCDISGATSEFLFTRKPVVLAWGPHLKALGLTRKRVQALYPFAYLWDVERQSLDDAVHTALHDEALARRRERAADDVFRGHRTLDEAARTFDLALSVMPLRRTRVPLRVLFEARVRLAGLLRRRG